eukprot:4349079-Alexandrium_andersonii.AAC.1
MAVVEAVIAEKAANPSTVRPNPDAPGCKEAMQYRVIWEDGDNEQNNNQKSSGTQLSFDVDASAGPLIQQRLSGAPPRAQQLPRALASSR